MAISIARMLVSISYTPVRLSSLLVFNDNNIDVIYSDTREFTSHVISFKDHVNSDKNNLPA